MAPADHMNQKQHTEDPAPGVGVLSMQGWHCLQAVSMCGQPCSPDCFTQTQTDADLADARERKAKRKLRR